MNSTARGNPFSEYDTDELTEILESMRAALECGDDAYDALIQLAWLIERAEVELDGRES